MERVLPIGNGNDLRSGGGFGSVGGATTQENIAGQKIFISERRNWRVNSEIKLLA